MHSEAIEILEQRGWCRTWEAPGKGECIVGAVYRAIHRGRISQQTGNEIYRGLMGKLNMAPEAWNDRVCQSKEEAIEVLRCLPLR